MISVTSIEEIVKYQQELLNHQRNQKLIQQETIKLLNALNKNVSFMSDRLDEFAMKTNIKLEDCNNHDVIPVNNSTNSLTVDSFFNSCFDTNNEIDYLNLNDLNDHPNQSQTITSIQPQQLIIIQPPQQQQDIINKNTSIYTTTATPNKINKVKTNNRTSNRSISISKLLDATNTTPVVSRPTTSDESIDEDISYDETETDEEEEKETIQVKKKPRNTIFELTNNLNQTGKQNNKEVEESNNQQRFFNKYVRETVERKLGKDFLLLHEIQEISPDVMEEIKNEALQAFPPVNIRPRRAWHLAKASLRCRRRSLKRQKEKQILSTSSDSLQINNDEQMNSSLQLAEAITTTIVKILPI